MVLIASDDRLFVETIGKALDHWGVSHLRLGESAAPAAGEEGGELVLFDIRELADDAFGQVYAMRQHHAAREVVLVNRVDNVAASIAGMKAGAVDEIIVPVDIDTLRAVISEACERLRAARATRARKPLFTRFSEVMMAATFAQAGDFAGALDLLEESAPPRNEHAAVNPKNK